MTDTGVSAYLPGLVETVDRENVAALPDRQQRLRSNADDLREVIEVLVSRMQRQIVLQHQRRQPHVVGGNRGALFPELTKKSRVVMGRLVVGEEHAHPFFQEKPPEYALVLGLPPPVGKAGTQLADHHKWQHDGLGFLQERHRLVDAFAEIDISVRVDRNPHRQRASSTRS